VERALRWLDYQDELVMAWLQLATALHHNRPAWHRAPADRLYGDLEPIGMYNLHLDGERIVSHSVYVEHPCWQCLPARDHPELVLLSRWQRWEKCTTMNPCFFSGLHTIQPAARAAVGLIPANEATRVSVWETSPVSARSCTSS
jgi:hypothetical protein